MKGLVIMTTLLSAAAAAQTAGFDTDPAGALPAGSTTDQGNLPLKPSHDILLPVSLCKLSHATLVKGSWRR